MGMDGASGRVLIIEPGIGYLEEHKKYSLITNYSLIKPESTKNSLFQVMIDMKEPMNS